jgi:hypothetical protein
MDVAYVDHLWHAAALRGWLNVGRRRSSLVDWACFEMIAARPIDRAFAFDGGFADQGIEVVPS